MLQKWPKRYLLSCSVVLIFAGLSKLYTLFSGVDLLKHLDPVFSVRMGPLLGSVAILEIAIGLLACSTDWQRTMSLGIVSLSLSFFWYRGMLIWLGFSGYCNCLGNLHLLVGVPESFVQWVTLLICFYFAAGGILSLWMLRTSQGRV